MTIGLISYMAIDHTQWAALVRGSRTGTWFQSREAYDFFAGMPELFQPFAVGVVRQEPDGECSELRGVCVGYVTVEKNPLKQFFTRRAIIYGGPCLADDATGEEAETLMNGVAQGLENGEWRLEHDGPIYIETRNFNDYSRWREAFERAGFAYKRHLNFHVDCTDKAQMDRRLSDTRAKQIRRARRAGVEVEELEIGDWRLVIEEWYAILREMYRTKVKTPLWPVEFFISAYERGVAKYRMVKYEGQVIGGLMMVKDDKCVYEWFVCGQDMTQERQYPSVMATYAGMEYAHEHGIPRCDFMGAGEPDIPYGVRDFKERFGGEKVEHGRFLHVCKPLLYAVGTIGVRMMKK